MNLVRIVHRRRHHLQCCGQRRAFHDERVVASNLERRWQPGEQITPIVIDARRLAMHGSGRSDYVAAIRLSDSLVTEAHPEGRNTVAERPNGFYGDPRLGWRTRAGREDHRRRSHRGDLLDRYGVVAADDDLGPKLAKVLDEVVRERVVVVDDEEHGGR